MISSLVSLSEWHPDLLSNKRLLPAFSQGSKCESSFMYIAELCKDGHAVLGY
jgi:hypothetical protein